MHRCSTPKCLQLEPWPFQRQPACLHGPTGLTSSCNIWPHVFSPHYGHFASVYRSASSGDRTRRSSTCAPHKPTRTYTRRVMSISHQHCQRHLLRLQMLSSRTRHYTATYPNALAHTKRATNPSLILPFLLSPHTPEHKRSANYTRSNIGIKPKVPPAFAYQT